MKLKLESVEIDVEAYKNAVRGDDFWRFVAEKWHEAYAPFVPYDTGALYETVRFAPGEIEHLVSYAQKVYEGDYDFRRDVHPFATGRWDIAAAPTCLPQVIDAMQAYVDAGGLHFDE